MNKLAVILSFFITVLAVLPCADVHACAEERQDMSSTHEHSEGEQDHCPPFCGCMCCGVTFTFDAEVVTQEQMNEVLFASTEFEYSFLYALTHLSHIWHPPTFA